MFQELLSELRDIAPNASEDNLTKIVSFSSAMHSTDIPYTQSLPDFPTDSLKNIAQIIQNNPNMPIYDAVHQIYPYSSLLSAHSTTGIETLFQSLKIPLPQQQHSRKSISNTIEKVERNTSDDVNSLSNYKGTVLSNGILGHTILTTI